MFTFIPVFNGMIVYLVLLFAAASSYFLKKLTLTGTLTGFLVAALIYIGSGYVGITLLAVFFVLASLSSRGKGECRTAGQVIANGGVAGILSLFTIIWPQYQALFQLMIAGSLASATADTMSSELGTVYGKKFINIITLKKDERGLDGVISLEGTLIGIGGAIIIGVVYCLFKGWSINLIYIVLAGFLGNIADSLLGATLERKGIIGNNTVNFLNTLIAALLCLVFNY